MHTIEALLHNALNLELSFAVVGIGEDYHDPDYAGWSVQEAMDHILGQDECIIYFHDDQGKQVDFAWVMPHEEPEDMIVDCLYGGFVDGFTHQFA